MLSLLVGANPADEHKCFAEWNASMLIPISKMIPMAVKLVLVPGAVWKMGSVDRERREQELVLRALLSVISGFHNEL